LRCHLKDICHRDGNQGINTINRAIEMGD